MQYKRNVTEGTEYLGIPRKLRSISTWEKIIEPLSSNQKQGLDYQYQEKFSDGIVLRSLSKVTEGRKILDTSAPKQKEETSREFAPHYIEEFHRNC